MNQNKVLAEANRLVSNGLRKAAIDLLHEYLDTDPDSTKVLDTLGRAYLLDRQPEKGSHLPHAVTGNHSTISVCCARKEGVPC